MPATFGDAWNQAWLDLPDVGALQVRQWAQDAFKALSHARVWTWRLKQAAFQILQNRTLASVNVTRGSTTVSSVGLFLAADNMRQFRVGTYPVYTITFVDANTITLDRVFEGATNPAAAAEILSAYVTAPSDLDAIQVVVDMVNQVRIGHWYTQQQLSFLDPTRTNAYAGPVRGLFSLKVNAAGLAQWEAWPYSTSPATLPFFYSMVPADLNDTDFLPGVLGNRPDLIAKAAKHQSARFPGTAMKKNPYFNLELAQVLGGELAADLRILSLRDDDQFQQDLDTIPWYKFPIANLAPTAEYLRASDAAAGDLGGSYGYGSFGYY